MIQKCPVSTAFGSVMNGDCSVLWCSKVWDSFRNVVIFAQYWSFLNIFDDFPLEFGVMCENPQGLLLPCGQLHFCWCTPTVGKFVKNLCFIVNTKNTWILMKFKQNQDFLGVYWKTVFFVLKYSVWSRFDPLQSQLWMQIPSGTW